MSSNLTESLKGCRTRTVGGRLPLKSGIVYLHYQPLNQLLLPTKTANTD